MTVNNQAIKNRGNIMPEHKKMIVQKNVQQLTDQTRTQELQERLTKDAVSFSIKLRPDFSAEYIFSSPATQDQKEESFRATLFTATGSSSNVYGRVLLGQALSCINQKRPDTHTAALEALVAMNPKDEYEGMLCSRLIVLHDQYMDFMSQPATTRSEQNIDLNINRATKLMRLYNETLETLNRYRRKGEQRVTVQHVNVNQGGQAVITGEMTRGGGHQQKAQE